MYPASLREARPRLLDAVRTRTCRLSEVASLCLHASTSSVPQRGVHAFVQSTSTAGGRTRQGCPRKVKLVGGGHQGTPWCSGYPAPAGTAKRTQALLTGCFRLVNGYCASSGGVQTQERTDDGRKPDEKAGKQEVVTACSSEG